MDVSKWKNDDVLRWLGIIRLDKYTPIFKKEKINGKDLLSLEDSELKNDLHITLLHDRKKLARKIAKLTMKSSVKQSCIHANIRYNEMLFTLLVYNPDYYTVADVLIDCIHYFCLDNIYKQFHLSLECHEDKRDAMLGLKNTIRSLSPTSNTVDFVLTEGIDKKDHQSLSIIEQIADHNTDLSSVVVHVANIDHHDDHLELSKSGGENDAHGDEILTITNFDGNESSNSHDNSDGTSAILVKCEEDLIEENKDECLPLEWRQNRRADENFGSFSKYLFDTAGSGKIMKNLFNKNDEDINEQTKAKNIEKTNEVISPCFRENTGDKVFRFVNRRKDKKDTLNDDDYNEIKKFLHSINSPTNDINLLPRPTPPKSDISNKENTVTPLSTKADCKITPKRSFKFARTHQKV